LDKTVIEDIDILALAARFYPFCRNITGNGVRQTLREVDIQSP
jgi:aminopeptidase-like protein